jgi:hypothetical protein
MAGKYEKAAAQFVSVLLHSGTNAHFMHLQTKSFAEHMALGEYYDEIIDIADRWAEAYQGLYDIIGDYPNTFHVAKDPKVYLTQIKDFVDKIRETLPEDTQLQNIVDEVCELIDSTLYKLRFLH